MRYWTKEEKKFVLDRVIKQHIHPYDVWKEYLKKFDLPRNYAAITSFLKNKGVSYRELVKEEDKKSIELFTKTKAKKIVQDDVEKIRFQQKFSEINKKYKILVKERSIGDRMAQILKDEAKVLPKFDIIWKTTESKVSHETAVLLLSDFHLGETVVKKEVYGLGEYNIDIFAKRLKFLANSIKNITIKKLRGYEINKLCIFMLGDMISGMIHDELIENGEDVIFQILNGAYITAQFILEMSTLFKKIDIDGVVGNHGRLHKKPRFKKRYTNWDFVFYQFLSTFLANNERIKCTFPKSFFTIKKIYDWNFLLLHGDNIRGWAGIPWYGIERAMWRLGDLLQGQSNIVLHYKVFGHFHHTGELDRTPGELLINGSLIGGTEYSLGRLFEFDRPTQLFLGVHADKGLTWRYPMRADFPEVNKVIPYKYNTDLDAGKYMKDFLEKK